MSGQTVAEVGAPSTVVGMIQPTRRLLQGQKNRPRGAQLVEFALVLPIFLFLILFSIDMGRMVFYSGVVHDAAFTSARAGAQVGAAGSSAKGASRDAYFDAISQVPGNGDADTIATFSVERGASCDRSPTSPNRFVQVRGTLSVEFITPGMRTLLTIGGNGERFDDLGAWTLPATGIARCEVVRS